MSVSIIRLLNIIYLNPKLCCGIILFFNNKILDYDKVSRDLFHKICRENNIDKHPCLLFAYFDTLGIKIAIMPVNNTEFWSFRVYHNETITVISDYVSRSEATLGALESAISIYNSINKNESQENTDEPEK